MPENAADVAHLNYLHGPILLSGTDLRDTHRCVWSDEEQPLFLGCSRLDPLYIGRALLSPPICLHLSSSFSFMKHTWEASWAPEKEADRSHVSVLNLMHRIEIFGVHIPPLDLHVTATQVPREEDASHMRTPIYDLPRSDIAFLPHNHHLQVGPALVYLTWKSFAGEGVFVQSLTPQEPLLQVRATKHLTLPHRQASAPVQARSHASSCVSPSHGRS